MNLPAAFTQNIRNTFGERGRLFLEALPGLLDEAAQRWRLTDMHPADQLSYNFILFARRGEMDVVLKLGVPDRELTSEIHSLRHFSGRGMVRLLESDPGRGMLLLERLWPGDSLSSFRDEDATRIAADLMLRLWRPAPSDPGLLQLQDWFRGFERFRALHAGGTGPLDTRLLQQAEAIAADFFAEEYVPTLIHGDLHHFNILSSGRGWLAIDPKGVIGPAAYEVGPFLLNPRTQAGLPPDLNHLLPRRLDIFAETLALERDRLRLWGLAFSVLSAVWNLDAGANWKADMEAARILAALQS